MIRAVVGSRAPIHFRTGVGSAFVSVIVGISVYFNHQTLRSWLRYSSTTMASANMTLELPNNRKIPTLGLGTWMAEPGVLKKAVMTAIDVGYRHIDCAYDYQNFAEVGEGIRAKITDGTITRDDIHYTDKLWSTFHHPDDVEPACRHTLEKTGLDYIDLWIIHWPMAFKRGSEQYPTDDNGKYICEDIDYVDTWKAMEKVYDKGLVKAIGLSNFPLDWLKRVLAINRVPVANLQIELHPYLTQVELVDFCKSNGISVTAYSPLGSPGNPYRNQSLPFVLKDPIVKDIAERKGKSPAQILIRFALQRGICVIPKSTSPSRMAENLESYNFELTEGEMKQLFDLNKDLRLCLYAESFNSPLHPFSPQNTKK